MFAKGLRCTRCAADYDLGPYFRGCPACGEALEVIYNEAAVRSVVSLERWSRRSASVWRYAELLPLPAGAERITLGEGGTPMIRVPRTGGNPLPFLYLQNETVNPTYAFKDRFHSVSISMARRLGFDGVVCSTTGNHGMSAAAYAARAGMRCVVLADPRAPKEQRDWMRLFGATVVVEMNRKPPLQAFVEEHGWYPSTYMTPMPVSTPYGVEGYKTMAYDAVLSLGRAPDHYLFPVAAGDGLYGPWKGFQELYRLGLTESLPRMHGVQAAGANPIVEAIEKGLADVPVHPGPETVALSIADDTGGRIALQAIRDSGGTAVEVTDAAIFEALRRAAGIGVSPEPASAAALAGAWELARQGVIEPGDFVVCCITGAGPKWPGVLSGRVPGEELVNPGQDVLDGLMSGH